MSDQTTNEPNLMPMVSVNESPSVTVFACGGAGTNMIRAIQDQIGSHCFVRYIDTGKGNHVAGLDINVIGGGGAGLNRSHHAETIRQWIADRSDEDLGINDINIVVFSLSGGSGSVIGPYLVRDIMTRRKKLVIAITIASMQSEAHTDNTMKTLQSLEKIAQDNQIHLPLSIYNNEFGVEMVDRILQAKLVQLIYLLTLPSFEVDYRDRLNWIDIKKTIKDAHPGLRLLHILYNTITQNEEGCEVWPKTEINYIYDTILHLRTERYKVGSDTLRARVRWDGLYKTVELVPAMGIIGTPPDVVETFLRQLNDASTAYKTQAKKPRTLFGERNGDIEDDVIF